jgi:hypothetical protein
LVQLAVELEYYPLQILDLEEKLVLLGCREFLLIALVLALQGLKALLVQLDLQELLILALKV